MDPVARWRSLALFFAAVAVAAVATAGWVLLRSPQGDPPAGLPEPPAAAVEEEPPPDRLELAPVGFHELPGWAGDRHSLALPALRRTCRVLAGRPPEAPVGRDGLGGTAGLWRPACRALAAVPGDDRAARTFFEEHFRPYAASNRGEVREGFLTGYFEPTLHGSRCRTADFRVPLYLRPPDLVSVDLGRFREDLEGRRIAGRLEGGALLPFHDRAAIDSGALRGRDLELVWVDDAIDAFFLHVQGSGRIELVEGGSLRVGYAAQNGHPYRSIGRLLADRGAIPLEQVTLPSIRRWLEENPEEAREVLAGNPSYVFFRELPGEGPVGSLGVVLTPGRSLAVDPLFLPLGAPVWIDGAAPDPNPLVPDVPLRRLVVAQDTGGAIRGPLRGDLFWGPGDRAAAVAGRMKHPARLWLLLPREVTPPAAVPEPGGS